MAYHYVSQKDMDFTSIIDAWLDCERGKLSSKSCIKFRWHCQQDLVELWRQIVAGEYKPRASMTFIVTHPVVREVWASAFRDRVVHHWEALRFGKTLDEAIVRHGNRSMNCRKGFGSLRTIVDFEEMLREYTENYTRDDCYIVGGDFSNFFMDIDKDILWSLMEKEIKEHYQGEDKTELLAMMHKTLIHRCQDHYFKRSPDSAWDALPKRKSLFYANGLPIGNLTSQIWANYFGSYFMDWVMNVLGYREFILFVDDWRALVRTAEAGRQLLFEAEKWLWSNLHIRLHPNKVFLQHYSKGTKFVGAIIKPGRVYTSNRTIGHFIDTMIRLIKEWGALQSKTMIKAHKVEATLRFIAKLRASVNSYLGTMRHHRSYRQRKKICERWILPTWGRYVYLRDEYTVLVVRKQYDIDYFLRKKLCSHNFAAKFIRPKFISQ